MKHPIGADGTPFRPTLRASDPAPVDARGGTAPPELHLGAERGATGFIERGLDRGSAIEAGVGKLHPNFLKDGEP